MQKNLRISYIDVIFFSLMVGLGETYFSAYTTAAEWGVVLTGLIQVIPIFVGSTVQAITLFIIGEKIRPKPMVLTLAIVQSLSLLTLAALIYFSLVNVTTVFILSSLYWAAGLSITPFWNIWMDHLIPSHHRTQFFARRSLCGQLAVSISLSIGSVVLSQQKPPPQEAFALLFFAAGFFRLISSLCLAKTEPVDVKPLKIHSQMPRTLGNVWFLFFALVFFSACYTSSPYFTPYMLSELKLDYAHYGVLIAMVIAGKATALIMSQKLARHLDARRILVMSAAAISLVPPLWTLSSSMPFLMVFQFISGIAWALFELTVFLWMFNINEPQRKRTYLLWYSLFQSTGMVLGTVIGGKFLQFLSGNYQNLFIASSALRMTALLLIPIAFSDQPFAWRALPMRLLGLRLGGASVDRPVILSEQKKTPDP